MNQPLTTLEDWASHKYGDKAPSIFTLRRWARDGKIYPQPEKHGRTYFVAPNAQYVRDYNDPTIASMLRGATQTQ